MSYQSKFEFIEFLFEGSLILGAMGNDASRGHHHHLNHTQHNNTLYKVNHENNTHHHHHHHHRHHHHHHKHANDSSTDATLTNPVLIAAAP